MVRKGLPRLYFKKTGWIFASGQFDIKIVIVRGDTDVNTTYLIWIFKKSKLEPAKTNKLSADNFKKYSTLMGRHLSPRYGQVRLVSGYPVLTAVNWWQHWWQSASSWAPKVAIKCESKHWYACGTLGRSVTWLPNFLGWVDYLSYGASRVRSSAIIRYFSYHPNVVSEITDFTWEQGRLEGKVNGK